MAENGHDEFYKTTRIKIPQSLLRELDKAHTRVMHPLIVAHAPLRIVQKSAVTLKAHYSHLLKSLYDAVILTDETGNIVEANDRAAEFFRYTLPELKQTPLGKLVFGAAHNLMSTIKEALRTNRYLLLQAQCVRQDATMFPAEISIIILELEKARYCLFVRDITVRRQSEEILRTGYNAISNANNGIAVANLKGDLVYVNPAAARLWGFANASEMLDRSVRDLWATPSDADTAVRVIIEEQREWQGELLGVAQDGRTFYVQVAAACNRDADEHLIGMVLSFTDITDRKCAEEAQRNAAHQQAMMTSLATACHHIGQPATVLLGGLTILRELLKKQDNHEALKILDLGLAAAQQLGEILHKLNRVSIYKTVNYLEGRTNTDAPNNKLLDLDEHT
ncbi:MAG: PAS domain S-box protein [Verrucomicrobia bacterium]|nr:MAG: PAS domain S-box protein [Verrucomicrobiota bacterium]